MKVLLDTYMERAETLSVLRGDRIPQVAVQNGKRIPNFSVDEFRQRARERFPPKFIEEVPHNAQR
jgi:hypothetical protein